MPRDIPKPPPCPPHAPQTVYGKRGEVVRVVCIRCGCTLG